MASFAFWFKRKDGKKGKLSAVLNFNLWNECGKQSRPVLDIGFILTGLENAESLIFYCPFIIPTEKSVKNFIEDLIEEFDENLASAIFNETLTFSAQSTNEKFRTIENNNTKEKLSLYTLDTTNDLTIEKFEDSKGYSGTKLIFKLPQKLDTERVYFRFRIKDCDFSSLVHTYTSENASGIQALFNETSMLDFRFNNVRSLSPTLLSESRSNGNEEVMIEKAHFLLMSKAYVTVDTTSTSLKSIRKLEEGIWNDYLKGTDVNTADLLAYQFSFKPEMKSENSEKNFLGPIELFVKSTVEKSVIKKYIWFTLLFGCCGSFIANILWSIPGWLKKIIEIISRITYNK